MKDTLKIINAQIISPDKIIRNGSVLVRAGKIVEVSETDIECGESEILDARHQYLSPGFIDIHVHGGGGHDFMDRSVEAFLGVAEAHARFGTTAMFPTTLTSTTDKLKQTLDCYKEANENNIRGAQFMGVHLEGPYFAMSQRGAQDPKFIRNPDPKEYKEILEQYGDIIARWSAAPELPGAIEFGKYIKSKGVMPAVAHTDAVYEDVLEAFENGYTLLTHFYSGMSGVIRRNAYRYAGVVEAGYLMDGLDVEVIADGIHLPAPLLKLIYKIKGPSRIALVTDAMRGAGMPEGESILGDKIDGTKVLIEDGVAKLLDRTAFAGSIATADRLIRTMIQQADVPLADAIQMITATPARVMGIDNKKGSIVIGKDADFVIFDENIEVSHTIINGKVVYESGTYIPESFVNK